MELHMIHVVTAENRHLYEREMRAHHRLRHDIYIVEQKWKNLQAVDGLEFDQFDNDDAVYLLAIENGYVVGGSRFVSTIKPHLLSEVFPSLADVKGVPRAPDIFEWTRFFAVSKRRDGRVGGGVTGKLMAGVFEFLVDEEARGFTFVCEAWWLPRVHQWGWKLSPLGLPGLFNDEWLVASYVTADRQTLERIRHDYKVEKPILIRRGISQPAIPRVA
jgi:acyl-homoserine lactone synthase